MATIFFSYAHADEALRNELEKHLAMLKREGAISTWHDRQIRAGESIDSAISKELEAADVILLLVSADFLSSEYCYGIEMKEALARAERGEAQVIPIILRPCDWHSAPFGRLRATPMDGKPITRWPDVDEAFLDIARTIRQAVNSQKKPEAPQAGKLAIPPSLGPRSSNLRMRKDFSQKDKDDFLEDTFVFMSEFFRNTLSELERRNPGIEGRFKQIDANTFTAAIYRNGDAVARCTIRLGGHWGGISFAFGHDHGNSINENLTVEAGDQSLWLKGFGLTSQRSGNAKLTKEGAADHYWALFFEPMQR